MKALEYLQKQGLGSRKMCCALINQGRVKLNGALLNSVTQDIVPAEVECLKLDNTAQIIVPVPHFYVLLHKPKHYETSHQASHYPSVFSLLPHNLQNLAPRAVGRLDADTTGVLLITNDGAYNHRQTSPKHHVQKTYRVTLKHPAGSHLVDALQNGVMLRDSDTLTRAQNVTLIDGTTLMLSITEGRYHQVKRMIAATGNRVETLHRSRFGDLSAEHLVPGEWEFFVP